MNFYRTMIWLSLSTSMFSSFAAHAADRPNLKQQLEEKKASGKTDPKAQATMEAAIEQLRHENLLKKAKKVGDKFPDFELTNAKGEKVSLKALRKNGPVIITFYRGSWCPYCNIQLQEYQLQLAGWEEKGAKLVALSPELPSLTKAFAEKKALTFDLLFDKDNSYARKIGLVYGIKGDLKAIYKKFGLDLEKTQGNPAWELPVSATYVVGVDGKVKFAFLDVDYKNRAEPADISAVLEKK